MRCLTINIFLLLLTSFDYRSVAQQYIFTSYSSGDGLVSNYVRQVFQDSKGFLWIATQEGISKYDGYRFTNYDTHNGLSLSFINDFYESKDGRLYIACNDGSIDAIIENKVFRIAVPEKIVINRFSKAPDGKVIATTDHRGFQEFSNGKLVQPDQPFPWRSYFELIWISDSLFMAVSDSSIGVYNKNYELRYFMNEQYDAFTERMVYMDSQKRIWFCGYKGLKQLVLPAGEDKQLRFAALPVAFDIPLLKENPINHIFEDDKGTFWIGTNKGLVKISTDGSNQLIRENDGFNFDIINYIFQDREKNIWFGTDGGLSKFPTQLKIRIYGTADGLQSRYLHFVHPVKRDYVLAGTDKGMQLFNTTDKRFKPLGISDNTIYADVVSNSKPLLSFGTHKVISIDTVLLELEEKKSVYIKDGHIWDLARDKDGNLFWGNSTGVYFFTGKKQDSSERVLSLRLTCLLIDKDGSLWIGTWQNGLYRIRYEVKNNKLNVLSRDHYLAEEKIRSVSQDSKGNIWVGTRYSGVYRLKNGSKVYPDLHMDKRNGLASNWIKDIKETSKGAIWLAYYQGLDKLIPQDSGFRVFNFNKVYNYFPNISTVEIDQFNSLWLSTTDGMVEITDEEIENLSPLPVYITSIMSFDSVYSTGIKNLDLDYRDNRILFEFSSPGFLNEKQIVYSYRLTGNGNNEWSPPSNEHSVSFASLGVGTYTFEVRSLGWNGQWGKTTSFAFRILPPFWQTWWFRVCCVLFIAAVAIWLVRRRIKYIRHEAELKNKMAEAEMAALRSQMNPHFIFNCLNAIDNLIQTNQKDKATVYLSRFAKLIRNVLDSSKNNTVLFQKDYESLQLYLQMEQFRCGNRFQYELEVSDDLVNGDYKVPPLIVQPFVENAIHHGLLNKESNDRRLKITAETSNDYIQYTVSDNGIGRRKAKQLKEINKPEHQSYGIQITEERIQLYNQSSKTANDVTITDLYEGSHPCGTEVVIQLKIAGNN
jgi:ligand-binding sensor domain-containing protein